MPSVDLNIKSKHVHVSGSLEYGFIQGVKGGHRNTPSNQLCLKHHPFLYGELAVKEVSNASLHLGSARLGDKPKAAVVDPKDRRSLEGAKVGTPNQSAIAAKADDKVCVSKIGIVYRMDVEDLGSVMVRSRLKTKAMEPLVCGLGSLYRVIAMQVDEQVYTHLLI